MVVNLRGSLAAGWRQVPQVGDDGPLLLVTQDSLGTRHPAGPESVVDDPLQLTVRVFLYLAGRERRWRRRKVFREGDSGVLAVIAVASDAVMAESLLAIRERRGVLRKGTFRSLVSNRDVVLDRHGHRSFSSARRL